MKNLIFKNTDFHFCLNRTLYHCTKITVWYFFRYDWIMLPISITIIYLPIMFKYKYTKNYLCIPVNIYIYIYLPYEHKTIFLIPKKAYVRIIRCNLKSYTIRSASVCCLSLQSHPNSYLESYMYTQIITK